MALASANERASAYLDRASWNNNRAAHMCGVAAAAAAAVAAAESGSGGELT